MMLGEPVWYWLIFALAALLVIGVPLAAWWEDRQDERDREAWDTFRGPRSGL